MCKQMKKKKSLGLHWMVDHPMIISRDVKPVGVAIIWL